MNFKSLKAALGQAVQTGATYAKDLSSQVRAWWVSALAIRMSAVIVFRRALHLRHLIVTTHVLTTGCGREDPAGLCRRRPDVQRGAGLPVEDSHSALQAGGRRKRPRQRLVRGEAAAR